MNKILLAVILQGAWFCAIAQSIDSKVNPELAPSPLQPVVQSSSMILSVECCKQYAEFVKTALPTTLTELVLDEKSPTFDFGKGLQSYLLIQLPSYAQPYSFSVTNLPQKPGFFNSTNYTQVSLRVETFDADFASKRVYKHDSMKKRGIGYDKTVFINPQNQTERYVLIYGDTSAASEEVTISKTDVVFVGTGFFIGGEDKKIFLAANDKGVLKIESKGLPNDK